MRKEEDFILELEGITKIFPGIKALDDVRMDLRQGGSTPSSAKTAQKSNLLRSQMFTSRMQQHPPERTEDRHGGSPGLPPWHCSHPSAPGVYPDRA